MMVFDDIIFALKSYRDGAEDSYTQELCQAAMKVIIEQDTIVRFVDQLLENVGEDGSVCLDSDFHHSMEKLYKIRKIQRGISTRLTPGSGAA